MMKISLTPARLMRVFFFSLLALLPGLAGPVLAGDIAERQILGFSPDGRYFAFEQYGVQDGSGYPYADIFFIDTISDEWISGSPFRVLVQDEGARLPQARKEAAAKAGSLMQQLGISESGRLLASNPVGELGANPHLVEVNASRIALGPLERWTFTLDEKIFAHKQCASYTGQPVKGFALSARKEGEAASVLHDDASIPSSRGCPLRYAISDIVVLEPVAGGRIFAILVSVYTVGFEGPDRRFLAVTRRMP